LIFVKKLSDLNCTYFRIFQFILCYKASYIYSQSNETLINSCLLFAQQQYNWKERKHGGHVVYVTEQTDQFQKSGRPKTLARKYYFFKSKNLI